VSRRATLARMLARPKAKRSGLREGARVVFKRGEPSESKAVVVRSNVFDHPQGEELVIIVIDGTTHAVAVRAASLTIEASS
jgi:hypothetical protein